MSATANRVIGCARQVLTQLEQERRLEREPIAASPRIEARDRETATRSPAPRTRSDLETVVSAATAFYQGQLREPAGAEALEYLRGRGIDNEAIDRWQLGYAPGAWEALTLALRQEGFSEDLLLEAGVAGRSRHGRLYDRMRSRVIFPIHDEHGAPGGVAGRLLSGDGPKYLNTPETALYQKRSLLYGLHLAHQPILDAGNAVLVEGYTDTIAAHLAGLTNVVATGGTALTEEHLGILARTIGNVIFAFDGDHGGLQAVERAAELDRASRGIRLHIARLPEGLDPADLLANGGKHSLQEAIANAAPLEHHLIDQIVEQHRLDEPEAMARAIRTARSVLCSATDIEVRTRATEYLATRVGRDVAIVSAYLEETSPHRTLDRRRGTGRSLA